MKKIALILASCAIFGLFASCASTKGKTDATTTTVNTENLPDTTNTK